MYATFTAKVNCAITLVFVCLSLEEFIFVFFKKIFNIDFKPRVKKALRKQLKARLWPSRGESPLL